MRTKIVESSIMFIIVLKQRLLELSPIWVLILPLQTLFIFLQTIQAQISSRSDTISLAFTNMWSAITSGKACSIITILHFCFTMVLLGSYLLYILAKKPYHEFDPHLHWFNRLMTLCAVLVILIEIILFNLFWLFWSTLSSIASRYQSPTVLLQLCMLAIGLVAMLAVAFINHRIRMLGSFFALFVFVTSLNLTVSFINEMVGTAICVYMIYTDEASPFLLIQGHNMRKILHFVLISYLIWRLIDSFQSNFSDYSAGMSFVFLLTHFLVGLIAGALKFRQKINRKLPPVIQLCQCLQALQKRPDDLDYKMVALQIKHEYFRDANNHITWFKDTENSQLTSDDFEDLNKLQKLVHFMIKQEYLKEPSLESGINMIKCRLMIADRRLFQIIYLLTELINKYKDRDLSAKYEILKITMMIQSVIFQASEKQSNITVNILKAVDQLNLKFYEDCSKQMESLFKFWQTVAVKLNHLDADKESNPELQTGDFTYMIDNLIAEIQGRVVSLRQCVKSISSFSISTVEKSILERVEHLTNFSRVETPDQPAKEHHTKKNQSRSEANIYGDYSQYLQVSNERITNVSLKLSTQLGYKNFELVGQKIDSIIPSDYQHQIENAVKNHHEPSLKISCLIPLRCVDNTIIFKKVVWFLQLDYNQGFKMYYFFYNSFRNQDPIIVYNTISNTIDYYNKPFLEVFNLDKVKIDVSIANSCFRPDEIFTDIELGDKNIQVKLTQSDLETEYNCRMSPAKIGKSKANKLEDIRLSTIEKEKHYMILKVVKGHRLKSFVGGDYKSQHSVSESQLSMLYQNNSSVMDSKLNKLKNRAKDQSSIYCPIQNPYESKILNKKAELVSSNNLALKFYAVLCISIVTILMMAQGFFFVQMNQKINTVMQVANNNTLNKFDQYQSLMLAYKSYFQRVLAKFQLGRIALPMAQSLLATAQQDVELQVKNFQKKYLENLLSSQKKSIAYTIKFQRFSVQTDSSKTNLFDFSRNLLQFDDIQSLNFLLVNYPSLWYLISQQNIYKSDMYSEAKLYVVIHYVASGVIFLIVVLCIAFSTILRTRVLNISCDVQFIYKLISPKKLDPLFHDIKALVENIPQIRERCQIKWDKIDTKLMKNNYRQRKSIEAEELLLQLEEQDEVNLILEENKKKQLIDKRYQQHKIDKPLKLKQLGIYGYIAVLGAILIIILFQILYFEHKIQDASEVFEFKIENRRITQNVIQQILQAQYELILAHDNKQPEQKYSEIFSQKLSINNKKLPSPAFDAFYQLYLAKISYNLCNTLNNKSFLQYNMDTCNKVGNGIFSYGLPKSIQFLNQMLKLSVQKKYWMNLSPYGDNLLQVQEVFYSGSMVIGINSEAEDMLASQQINFNASSHNKAIMIFILACSLSLILVAINIYMKKYIYKASQIAVGLFLIMPKAILLQSEVLDHIRKNNMLKRISTI